MVRLAGFLVRAHARLPMFPHASRTVAAAFAQERDAGYAVGLIASSPDLEVRLTRRSVVGEHGEVQLVILEATLQDPTQADRVASCMVGAHGVRITPEGSAADVPDIAATG